MQVILLYFYISEIYGRTFFSNFPLRVQQIHMHMLVCVYNRSWVYLSFFKEEEWEDQIKLSLSLSPEIELASGYMG
jgi:hypothetical protein